jgi:hypothetical protein
VRTLKFHKEGNYLYIDEMEIIKPISNDKEATRELTNSKGNSLVYHTSHDTIRTKLIKDLGLFRRFKN